MTDRGKLGSGYYVDWLRRARTTESYQRAIKHALTFPLGDARPEGENPLTYVYNESCFQVDDFVGKYEERWGFRWLPKKPQTNENPVAGLREHYTWWGRVEKAVRSELPCRFDPEKVDLSIKRLEELRGSLVKYPSYDEQLWERAKERAGVPEKLSSMNKTSRRYRMLEEARRSLDETGGLGPRLSRLRRQVQEARVTELEAALEAQLAYSPEVDRCYRELDGRYATTVQQLAEDVEHLWKDRILSIWDRQEPIWLYDALTGKTIGGPMQRMEYTASEIADGRMANPSHRARWLNDCETLIALFRGFRAKISQAKSDAARSSEEGMLPQTGATKGQLGEEEPTAQRQSGETPGPGPTTEGKPKRGPRTPQKGRKKTPPQLLKETRERQAAQELATNPDITARELAKVLACDAATVVRLQAWRKKGVIHRDPPHTEIENTPLEEDSDSRSPDAE